MSLFECFNKKNNNDNKIVKYTIIYCKQYSIKFKMGCFNKCRTRIQDMFGGNFLLIITFIAVIIGSITGYLLRPLNLSADTIMLIAFPGEILMRMLKMLVLPLIVTSIVTGVAVLDPKSSGKIGLYSVSYYLTTSVLAAIMGIFLNKL